MKIVDFLFAKFVDENATGFSAELYMTLDQLKLMSSSGMVIGGHGAKHLWLGKISDHEQLLEIQSTRDFLEQINGGENFVMCYPYGSFNEFTLSECRKRNFDIGLSTEHGAFDSSNDNPLKIKRMDTNCFPKS